MAGQGMYGVTSIHPLGLLMALVLGIALVVVPRRYAAIPMLLLACFIPSAQRIVIMGADFNLLRILVVFAWVRLLVRNEFHGFQWNRLDTMMIAWMGSGTLIFTMAYGTQAGCLTVSGCIFSSAVFFANGKTLIF